VAKSRIKQLSTASADFQDMCVLLEILQACNLMQYLTGIWIRQFMIILLLTRPVMQNLPGYRPD